VRIADAAGCGAPYASLALHYRRNMNEPDDKLGVHEELLGADPIPDVFPGQDPSVDREWEKAKEARWAVSPLELIMPGEAGSLVQR